jgi:hypothetical protein
MRRRDPSRSGQYQEAQLYNSNISNLFTNHNIKDKLPCNSSSNKPPTTNML